MSEPRDGTEIRATIQRLQAAPPYNDVMHPLHNDAVAAVAAQYERLFPKDGPLPMTAPRPDESGTAIGDQIEYSVPSAVDHAAENAYQAADSTSLENALQNAGAAGDPASIGLAVEWLQAIEAPAALASTIASQAARIKELPSAQQIDAAGVEAELTLRDEWGPAYETKLRLANDLVARLPADARVFLGATGLGNNLAVIRMMAATAEAQQRRAQT